MQGRHLRIFGNTMKQSETLSKILAYNVGDIGDACVSESWNQHMKHIQNEFIKNPPDQFLKFPTVRLTIFCGNSEVTSREYDYLLNYPKWMAGLKDSVFGCPERFTRDETTTGNSVHQTFHLATYENTTGKNILDFDYIFDFGGGYGCMAKILKNLNYKGKYVIFDIEFMSLIQKYYLESIGLKENEDFYMVNDIKDIPSFNENSLFISTWSLNEVPVKLREEIKIIVKNFTGILIAYNYTFDNVDNISYFKEWEKDLLDKSVAYNFSIKLLGHSNYLLM